MKGSVLGYDTAAEAIVVRAEDGRRYRFTAAEWREARSPRKGDRVDFEPDGDLARDIYFSSDRLSDGEAPIALLARVPVLEALFRRPVLLSALLVLVACLLGAYQIDGHAIALLSAPELISRMAGALELLVADTGTDPGPRIAAGIARIAMFLMLLLYAVPLLAGFVFWQELKGRADRRIAGLAGLAAAILPVALPLLVVFIVRAGGLTDTMSPVRLGLGGVSAPGHAFDILRLYGTGTVLLVGAGVALWAAAVGRWRLLAGPDTESTVPGGRAGAVIDDAGVRQFAPLRSVLAALPSIDKEAAAGRPAADPEQPPKPVAPPPVASASRAVAPPAPNPLAPSAPAPTPRPVTAAEKPGDTPEAARPVPEQPRVSPPPVAAPRPAPVAPPVAEPRPRPEPHAAKAEPRPAPVAAPSAGDDPAMAILADELRAVIGEGSPPSNGAGRVSPEVRPTVSYTTKDLPPLSASIWPQAATRRPARETKN